MSIYLLIYIKRNTGRINQKQDEMKLVTDRSERNRGKSDKSDILQEPC